MSHWRRMLAFILTVLLAVHGLPVVSDASMEMRPADDGIVLLDDSSAEENPSENEWKQNYPNTTMRFVQTGFDEETGILTMSLQIKPQPGTTQYTETVREGMFVFQVDDNRLTPVTRPREPDAEHVFTREDRKEIRSYTGRIAVVASDNSNMPAAFQNFLHDESKAEIISNLSTFNLMMSTEQFADKNTGYLVTAARTEDTDLLDCYLQFYFDDAYYPEPNDDGYVNVIDLDFQCYTGDTDVATAENILSKGVIRVPETAEEAQEIVEQFNYTGDETPLLAMGGAGFIQKYYNTQKYSAAEGQAYYYFDEPKISQWRGTASRTYWSKNANSITSQTPEDISVGLWYQNIESEYRVESISLQNMNTVATKSANPEADFYIPEGGSESLDANYPRYSIPTYKEFRNQETATSWIPQVYQGDKHSPLKYYISANVSNNSDTSPQSNGHFGEFVEGLKWEFLLEATSSSDSLETYHIKEEAGEGKLVSTTDGKYRVKVATLTDKYLDPNDLDENGQPKEKTDQRIAGTKLVGKKLWVVYKVLVDDNPEFDEYFMRTPVGVTLDMVESNEVHYHDLYVDEQDKKYDEETGDLLPVKDKATVPQFHLSYEAADPDNYIWSAYGASTVNGGEEKARTAFRAVYDPTNRKLASEFISVALYTAITAPSEADLDTTGTVEKVEEGGQTVEIVNSVENAIKSSAGENKLGFWIGNTRLDGSGKEIIVDRVDENKAVLHSTLYNQYHMPYDDKFASLEFVPTPETEKLYEKLGKVCPFEVVRETGNSYTIIYRDGMSVNDAVEGDYILRATYTEPGWKEDAKVIEEKPLYVSKAKDRLSYIRTQLNSSSNSAETGRTETVDENGASGTVIEMIYEVPVRDVNLQDVTNTEQISIVELANQWRDLRLTPADLSEYDLAKNIRDESGNYIDVEKATKAEAGFHISYTYSCPDGSVPVGVDISNVGSGSFTYDSRTPDKAHLNVKLTVTFDGITRFLEYRITFTRELRTLQEIRILPPYDQTTGQEQDSYTLYVPVPANPDVVQLLNVVPIDQYGSQWEWGGVEEAYKPGGRLNSGSEYEPWTVYVDDSLPSGVSLGGNNNMYVTVKTEAQTSSFTVRAKFAGSTSNPMVINIVRRPSVPTVVKNLYYNGNNQITPPDKDGQDTVYRPSIEIYDQYEALMTEYTTRWRYSVSPESAEAYVSVNPNAGELTVKKCAPDCTVDITAVVPQNGISRNITAPVVIKRDPAYPDSVQIVEDTVELPSSADTDQVMKYLTATGTTQYGEAQTFGQDAVTWRLESVKFADGAVLNRTEGGDLENEQETGEIPYDPSTLTYSARNMVFLTNKGGVRFARTTLASDVPQEITVTVICSNGVKTTKTLRVGKQDSVPDQLYFPQDRTDYTEGVQIPANGTTVEIPLYVYVRDQYGVIVSDHYGEALEDDGIDCVAWDLKWDYTLPDGVKLGADGHSILVDHTAKVGSIPFTVTCTYTDGTGQQQEVQSTLYISIYQNDKLVPTTIDITGYKKGSVATRFGAEADSFTLPLPVKPSGTATSYEVYTMTWTVRDQFTNALSRPVKWTASGFSDGVRAEFTDATSGILRLFYTDEAVAALGNGEELGFTLRVESADNNEVFKTIQVMLSLAAPVATYATPKLIVSGTEGEDYVNENDVIKPIIPEKGKPARTVKIGFTVYDQYGREMAGELADLKLKTASAGLSFTQAANATQGTLSIGSNVSVLLVTMEAAPHGKAQNVRAESALLITLSKGTAYAYELSMAEGNPDTFAIPTWTWGTGDKANVPVDVTDQVLLRAEVVDQYNAWMSSVSSLYHPMWEFAGDHTGVEFATGDENGDGIAEGEDIFLNITNRAFAIPDGKLVLKLHTSNQPEDEYFTKTFTLQLTREPAEPFYMDISVIDESGQPVKSVGRPYAEEKQRIYKFNPVVYDQYGAAIEDIAVDRDMLKSTFENLENILVENVYQKGQSEKKGDPPSGYKIYSVVYKNEKDTKGTRTLLAEFDRLTGNLTVYTVCDCLESFEFTADCPSLSVEQGGKKQMKIAYEEEDLRPEIVKINGLPKDYVMNGGKTPIENYAYPSVYDQYGATYAGSVSVVWDLLLPQKDEKGEYLPYNSELDKEGNERSPSQFLVTKSDGNDHGTTVTVQPESFYANKVVLLECIVIDNRYLMDQSRWKSGYAQINVHRPLGGGGINVYFDAGEYGMLVGESVISVAPGSAPENPPGVKTVEGYGFMGWTSDGVLVVDAAKIAVFGDITYTAVYKDITNTEFVEGYGDGTFHPEQHITRAEFVSMVVRSLGGYKARADYGSYFSDVAPNQWYASAIGYAKTMGIIDGYGDGTFRPNNPITRAEASRILADTAQLTSEKYGTFSDVDPDAWYAGYVEALVEAGVAVGYGDGTYRPRSYITRAESAKMIVQITVNALNELERTNIQKYAYCPFTDIKRGHWAYAYILRAAGVA